MATSSSDESSAAPKVFHLSSSLDSGSRLSPNKRKCPLCNNFKKTFHCKDCVHMGLFYHSKSKVTEGYIDKRRTLLELEENRRIIEEKCFALLEAPLRADILRSKIRQSRERNRVLKLLNEEKRDKKEKQGKKLQELREKNEKVRRSLPRYGHKVEDFKHYVEREKEKTESSSEQLEKDKIRAKRLVKLRVGQLLKYIFLITKVEPKIEMESSESDETVNALAEASRTTYISDKWELADSPTESHYSIIGPTLPRSGNYSLYNAWVAKVRDGIPGNELSQNVELNPAYSIGAALMYTAQLLNVLSFYLNIRLPLKMNFSDFLSFDMDEKQFGQRVASLNANILYLCFFQNVNLLKLHSCHETIYNLLQLMDTKNEDLGRNGPMEIDNNLASCIDEPLSSDLNVSDSSDSEESFPNEWEAVPHVQCPEVPAGPVNIQSTQMITTQQASSMAGGLVNSAAAGIASIWRGLSGR